MQHEVSVRMVRPGQAQDPEGTERRGRELFQGGSVP